MLPHPLDSGLVTQTHDVKHAKKDSFIQPSPAQKMAKNIKLNSHSHANETYRSRKWVWTDPEVILIEPGNSLYSWIEKIGNLLAGSRTLFLINDIIYITDETLDKKRQPLLELVISGRLKEHTLWLLTQSYTAVPKNIRRQAKMLYVWYPKIKQT